MKKDLFGKLLQDASPRYIVSDKTMMITPVNYEGATMSLVYEEDGQKLVHQSPKECLMESCKHYGSTLVGKIHVSKEVASFKKKVPITLCAKSNIHLFPTFSYKNEDCIWLSHQWIEKYYENKTGKTNILFKNNVEVEIPVSNYIIQNQYFRTSQLRIAPQLSVY